MKLIIFFAAFMLLCSHVFAAPPGDQSKWVMTFSDEFNGTSLDASKWAMARSDGGRNIADAVSWCIDGNVSVSDGLLHLKATNVQSHSGYPYSGAVISGHNTFNQMYGYFESSMKFPKGAGLWPAFWLMPKSSNNSWMWPPEIDIMEALCANTNLFYMTNHWGSNYPNTGGSDQMSGGSYSGPDFSAAFHTIGMLWDATQIAWYVDGMQVRRVTDHIPTSGYGWPGMYILFNIAVGGAWGGPPNSSTPWPSDYQVDWVRVWKIGTGSITVPSAPTNLRVN